LLDNEATLEIQHLIRDFKPADGDLLGALHAVQHHYGYVPKIAMKVVGRQLRLSEAKVYGAATFYSDFACPPPATLIGCSGAPPAQRRPQHPQSTRPSSASAWVRTPPTTNSASWRSATARANRRAGLGRRQVVGPLTRPTP
jgi:hypothetical protein